TQRGRPCVKSLRSYPLYPRALPRAPVPPERPMEWAQARQGAVNVKDCTDAGVLVVNQTGGNAEAVAAHVLAMVLMLSKQIVQTYHALRRGTMADRSAFMGNDVKGRTIGIVGIGNVGRRIAELCRALGMQVIACDPFLDEKTI